MSEGTPHAEKLIAAEKFLERFTAKKDAPALDPVEVGRETLTFLASLRGDDKGEKTAAAGGTDNRTEASPPSPESGHRLDPDKAASEILGQVHDIAAAKAVLKVAAAEKATFTVDAEGRTAVMLADGRTVPLSEAIDALGLGTLKPPAGAKGSGGRGGKVLAPREIVGGSLTQRYADSGYSFEFYQANRAGLLAERRNRK